LATCREESTKSSERAAKLVGDIITSFEEHMNRDLDVKAAFDNVTRMVSILDALGNREESSLSDVHVTAANLQKIDKVLQIIF
jgi:cysteinyl-tRNA synthetase